MRNDVADMLEVSAAIIGGQATLSKLLEPLQRVSMEVSNGAAFDWRAAEAALYCIRYASQDTITWSPTWLQSSPGHTISRVASSHSI
jgi:hypothetical protein